MTEIDLLAFGCAVLFLAYGGAYIFVRERYLAREREVSREPVRVPAREALPRANRAAH